LPSFEDYLVRPATNLDHLEPECQLDNLAVKKPKSIDKIDYILNNSFRMLDIKPVPQQSRSIQHKKCKTMILGSRRQRDIATATIFLIMVALILGTVGCALPPRQIQDWYDLDAIRDNPAGRYRLMNDLHSASPGYWTVASRIGNYRKGWQPIGTSSNPFTGSFDGHGYEISDLFINRPDEDEVGLFGCVGEGGVINDVEVVNAAVTGKQYVGGLAGNNLGTVSNSYFSGSVNGDQCFGGLVGVNVGTISNSHYNYNEVVINTVNMITIGALFAEDFHQWLANGKFLDFSQRLSQENGCYLVNNVSDLEELLAFGQDNSLRFRLTNNLDLGGEANFYIPYLAGEFDGNGHKILNLTLTSDSASQVGLFGYLAPGGKVTQLGVENVGVAGGYVVGGLVGGNNGIVSDCYCSGNVAGDDCVGGTIGHNWNGSVSNSYSAGSVAGKSDVGGLVGINDGALTNCHSSSGITGWESAGGLAGTNKGSVANSYSSGIVTAWYSVGSLVGINEGSLSNSYSIGNVTGWYSVGGLVGVNSETLSNSYSMASVTGRSDVGGLVGSNRGPLRYSYATGSVAGEQDVGGLVGSNYDTVRDSYATNAVAGEWNAGGLVGSNYGAVRDSYSAGSMTGNYYAGGLVGGNNGTVSNSFSTGSVTGNYYVGGLTGSNSGTVTSSYSTDSVTGSSIVSSLVGINGRDGTVSNSFSTGSAAGDYYVAGLAAVNFGTVDNSYSGANVTGHEYVGGLLAVNWGGNASSSFWDTESSGQLTSAGGTGKTTAEMQNIITFRGAGWDISAVAPGTTNSAYTWNIVNEQTYPFLS
jgi:hypothetical protein